MRKKTLKGLSPLISSAILLAATIAIGYIIYNYASNSAGAVVQKPQLLITASADYVGSTAYVELSIKNVGGAAANITKIEIDGVDVTGQVISSNSYLLQPGQEIHRVITIDSLPNGQHIVIVTATTANGDTYQFKATFIS